jgi:DNA-binding XRE family transcriptional regulator
MQTTNRLKEFHKKRGISAAGLAKPAGVMHRTIHAMEAGSYVPSTDVALQFGART